MDILSQIAIITFFAILAQWVGWKFKLPSIVFLLISGFIAGPILGWLEPEAMFGDLLSPAISIAVAIILFEGSLNLNFKELKHAGSAVRNFVIVGAPVGWIVTSAAAHYIGGLSWPVAGTFGGLLIVTGPTVIIPLLKHARLSERTTSILKWEGIVNDPIGAILAILVYEYFHLTQGVGVGETTFFIHALSALVMVVIGSIYAGIGLSKVLNRGLIPEYLKPAFILSTVVMLFVACNMLLHESGLIGVTILGVALANLGVTSIEEIKRFKETMTIMLVSGVFVVITAGIDPSIIFNLDMRGLLFIAAILFIIRPLIAFCASLGTDMTLREVLLTGWIAPRGIVCVAVAGIMGPLLVEAGYADGEQIFPLAFAIVLLTVFLHGLTAKPFGRLLGLAHDNTDGLLIVGASDWSVQFAEALQKRHIAVMIADRNFHALKNARLNNIHTYYGETLSEETEYNLEMTRYNKLLAATDNADYNALLCSHFAHLFSRERVFQLASHNETEHERKQITETIRGRTFASKDISYWDFARLFRQGWRFKTTRVDKDFNMTDLIHESKQDELRIIGVIRGSGKLQFQPPEEKSLKNDDIVILFEKDDKSELVAAATTKTPPDLPD